MWFAHEIEYIMSFDTATFIVRQWTAMWSTFIYTCGWPTWIACKRTHSSSFEQFWIMSKDHWNYTRNPQCFSFQKWSNNSVRLRILIRISHFETDKKKIFVLFERKNTWFCNVLMNFGYWFDSVNSVLTMSFTVAIKSFASVTESGGCSISCNCAYWFFK